MSNFNIGKNGEVYDKNTRDFLILQKRIQN